jgi:exodeoxyribonuclease VII large subunit
VLAGRPWATSARVSATVPPRHGRVVRSVADAAPGDQLDARLQDGMLAVRVESGRRRD